MDLHTPPSHRVTAALVEVGAWLKTTGYHFITPTPATHRRINSRAGAHAHAKTLRDAFGWSRPFTRDMLPPEIFRVMHSAGLVEGESDKFRSRVRFSTLGQHLFAHSAFPTDQPDSVFFGPDTYRFAALINAELQRVPLCSSGRILDIGCGAGPGGIMAALWSGQAHPWLALADINETALQFASANCALAGVDPKFALGDLFEPVAGSFDLIVSNPPYLNDRAARTYRHGGGKWGGALSERIVRDGVHRLRPGGRLVLYTGSAIVEGEDPFALSVRDELDALDALGWSWTYRELDPDVFGEELEESAYAGVERIAAVGLVVTRPAG
ncbi:MAG: methyltransferase [Pseudomonadota bacterium]